MPKYELHGQWFTTTELSEISGLKPHTIRDRLRRGYSVEEAIKVTALQDSVKEFSSASWYKDWVGMSMSDLYKIYWKWCVQHNHSPLQIQGFSRQLMSMYPMLKTIPTKRGDKCLRIIRLKERKVSWL